MWNTYFFFKPKDKLQQEKFYKKNNLLTFNSKTQLLKYFTFKLTTTNKKSSMCK